MQQTYIVILRAKGQYTITQHARRYIPQCSRTAYQVSLVALGACDGEVWSVAAAAAVGGDPAGGARWGSWGRVVGCRCYKPGQVIQAVHDLATPTPCITTVI